MSYILEALKKSDRERKQGEIPDLQSVHGHRPGHGEGKKKSLLRIWLSVGVVLGLSALALYWSTQRNNMAWQEKISALEESVVQLKEQPVGLVAHRPAVKEKASQRPLRGEADENVAVRQPPARQEDVVLEPFVMVAEADNGLAPKNAQSVPEEKTVIRPEDVPRRVAQKDISEMAEAVPLVQDLPSSVQEGLPPLKLAGHIYSEDSARRMIIINNRICREGEMVENQLYLEKILREGVVLRYRQLRFRMNIF
ncbi:MAG: general secretion pathway protein GspB [Desulfoarculaceae bacterium]|nr:general secretion pathway protein GspB [Desulfoarculaceae bacterium]